MNNFIVVVLPSNRKADDALQALGDLHSAGSIALYGTAVIQRDPEGLLRVCQSSTQGPLGLGVGAIVGGLVGLLGGAAGAGIGVLGGGFVGGLYDLFHLGLTQEFLEMVERHLSPGMYAVVCEATEEEADPLDARMTELGGTVIRERRQDVIEHVLEGRIATLRRELTELHTERDRGSSQEAQTKLSAQIDQTASNLRRIAEQARSQIERTEQEFGARIDAVQQQASRAHSQLKRKIDARIDRMRSELHHRSAKLRGAWEHARQVLRP
jgi:uncharacterized membrane protein